MTQAPGPREPRKATQKDWDELVRDAVAYEDESARCMLELRDRIVALEARRDVLRGFACDSRTPLVDRIARAIQPCMLVDVGLIRPASRDAIAEIADYLESEGLTGAAGQLRRQLRAES